MNCERRRLLLCNRELKYLSVSARRGSAFAADGHSDDATGTRRESQRGVEGGLYAATPERPERPLRYDQFANRARRRPESQSEGERDYV